MDGEHEVCQRAFEVPFPPKPPIKCLYTVRGDDGTKRTKTSLIFTHGAGGSFQAEAVVNFTHGFVSANTSPTLLCFQGNMNLSSRVKMFTAMLESRSTFLNQEIKISPACLGGRSMGARAAVMAATEETTHLVLVSYPLHTGKQVRDQILLDLPVSVKAVFISGDSDKMCDIRRLDNIRKRMKCKTWRIVVQGADHGMSVRPKIATRSLGRMTGDLVAAWLDKCDERLTEGTISWNPENSVAEWSGWHESSDLPSVTSDEAARTQEATTTPVVTAREAPSQKRRKKSRNEQEDERPKRLKSKKVRDS